MTTKEIDRLRFDIIVAKIFFVQNDEKYAVMCVPWCVYVGKKILLDVFIVSHIDSYVRRSWFYRTKDSSKVGDVESACRLNR